MNMNLNINIKEKRDAGFTLLELLIVISIIAILSVALVLVLNPAETLRKSRDAQRISDLNTVKTALGIMLTSTSTPSLDNTYTTNGTVCTTGASAPNPSPLVRYSATGVTSLTGTTGGTDSAATVNFASSVVGAGNGDVAGAGWIPAVLSNLVGGSPISSYPLDPTNDATGAATSASLTYRYTCQNASVSGKPGYIFEINAKLESTAYTTAPDNKMANDGGDNTNLYEVGNSLKLLPTGAGF